MSLRTLSLCLVTLSGLSLVNLSCGGDAHGSSASPEDIARAVVDAIEKRDTEGFKALLTSGARKGFESNSSFDINNTEFESPTLGGAAVNGDEASVPLSFQKNGQTQEMTFRMRREEGAWRLYGFDVSFAGASMTIDFEKFADLAQTIGEELSSSIQASFEKAQREQRERAIASRKSTYEALRPIDEASFERSWRVGRDLSSATRLDALTKLANEIGLELEVEVGEHAAALSVKVGDDVSTLSRLEAMDRIAAASGLSLEFPRLAPTGGQQEERSSGVRVASREEGQRRAYAGPFRVVVESVEEIVPYARGDVRLRVHTHDLDEGVLGLLSRAGETAVLYGAWAADETLLVEHENTRYSGGGYHEGRGYEDSFSLSLRNLVRKVDRVASVRGMRRLTLPLEVETVEFRPLRKGETKKVGAFTLTTRKVGTSTSIAVTGPKDSLRDLVAVGRLLDSSGDDVEVQYEGFSHLSKEGRYEIHTQAAPASLLLKLVTKKKGLEFPFEIRDVPLSRHADQPAALESLSFGNFAAPLSVRFEGFVEENPQFPEAKLQVVNHSNKDVENAQVNFVYVDARGKSLGEHQHTVQGSFSAEGWQPLAREGARGRVETTAFFRPTGTKGMKPVVVSVRFMDGTEWRRK